MPLPNRLLGNGPVTDYLNWLMSKPDEQSRNEARRAALAVRRCLHTDDGIILMELLEKSVESFFLPPLSEPRALDALNAQRFIALDLRRIASDETEQLLRQDGQAGRGRNGRFARADDAD